jgi:hypothetical protein
MTCPADWSAFGLTLIGIACLSVGLPLGLILWFVLGRTITLNPDEARRSQEME